MPSLIGFVTISTFPRQTSGRHGCTWSKKSNRRRVWAEVGLPGRAAAFPRRVAVRLSPFSSLTRTKGGKDAQSRPARGSSSTPPWHCQYRPQHQRLRYRDDGNQVERGNGGGNTELPLVRQLSWRRTARKARRPRRAFFASARPLVYISASRASAVDGASCRSATGLRGRVRIPRLWEANERAVLGWCAVGVRAAGRATFHFAANVPALGSRLPQTYADVPRLLQVEPKALD